MPDASSHGLADEIIVLRPATGRQLYLIEARREPCIHCSTGTRTVSVWAFSAARGEEVAWCRHCFNAECDPLPLTEGQRSRYAQIRAAITQGRSPSTWDAVRPALEDLERRGLL